VTSVQTKISARHGTVSDETQAKIVAKVEKLTRLFDRLTSIEITVDLERRDAPSVEFRVSAEHKHDFVATVQAGELMAAIDTGLHKVEQQLRKYKQRIQNRHRGAGGRETEGAEDLESFDG
jgi:putative sigma-54 modulation protein